MRRAGFALLVLAFSAGIPLRSQTPPSQAPPVFRGGVDLVTVDAVVMDKNGRPVTDLSAEDFTILADKKPRRIVSAEYIAARGPGTASVPVPGPVSNRRVSYGRTILFVIDVEEIRSGEGRSTLDEVRQFLEMLAPEDRVGLVSMPSGRPRIDPTTNKSSVREALTQIAGTSNRYKLVEMTPGEASAISHGDVSALNAYVERVRGRLVLDEDCHPGRPAVEPRRSVPLECRRQGEQALDMYLHHTRDMMDTLGALATAMGAIEGPKALVLVSEGLVTESSTIDSLQKFARAFERARVSFYAMHLEAPMSEAESLGGSVGKSRLLDGTASLAGVTEMSAWARGATLRVPGPATNALKQIDAEMSGYYLLSFESDPTDRGGESASIQVRVNRPSLEIRARREFTPGVAKTGPRPAASANLKESMTQLLAWPAAVGDIGLDLDTFIAPVAGSTQDARLLVVTEIVPRASQIAAVGYALANDTGKVVADQFDAPPVLQPIGDGRSLYAFALPAKPGKYRLRIGVQDEAANRGSVEQFVDIAAWTPKAIRVSDLMLSDETTSTFRPAALIRRAATSLAARLEVHADDADAFKGLTVQLQIERADPQSVLGQMPIALAETSQPLRRVAVATLNISTLGPGEYTVTAVISGPQGEVARKSRRFSR